MRSSGQLESPRGSRTRTIVFDPRQAILRRTSLAGARPDFARTTARLPQRVEVLRRARVLGLIRLRDEPFLAEIDALLAAIVAARERAGFAWRLRAVTCWTLKRITDASRPFGEIDGAVAAHTFGNEPAKHHASRERTRPADGLDRIDGF